MFRVSFQGEIPAVEVPEGTTLLEALRLAKLTPDAPCGGKGKCGKCAVRQVKGEKVLSCQTVVDRDMDIIPGSVQIEKSQILTETLSQVSCRARMPFQPMVQQKMVEVRPCPSGESISDWDRFLEAVEAVTKTDNCEAASSRAISEASAGAASYVPAGAASYVPAGAASDVPVRTVSVAPSGTASVRDIPRLASKLGPLCKQTRGKINVVFCAGEPVEVSAEPLPIFMAAFDIGTTTVAGFLLNASDGRTAAEASCMNPQAQYGADVINRANYTLEHGTEEVTSCIRSALGKLIRDMSQAAGITEKDIYAVSIAGNTCMHHFFLGISTDSLVHAPYNPAVSQALILSAEDYGLRIHPSGRLFMLPNIAGFVGADTVACLAATMLPEQKDWTLLIDIGTNGEMVLGRSHQMAACSTAAGPAFEGAGITCGMRGSAGAVCKVRWTGESWDFQTIGNLPPRGICGSGLLDLAAQLLISAQMDETGELTAGPVIVLADAEHSANREPVVLTQKDIRQLQLAKAAIASGIYLLAEKMGITLQDIREVWLAGAFGSFLSPDSACDIGLIPPELRGRITAVGNAAGEGAKRVLLCQHMWEYAQASAKESAFLELASMPAFQDRFVDELLFPEEDD